MNKITNFLRFLIRPEFWVMNYDFHPAWDRKVNDTLDNVTNAKFSYNTPCEEYLTCEINGLSIWIGNYPYGFGTFGIHGTQRPSRATIVRLKRFVDAEIAKLPPPEKIYAWDN
jgi:hypothetical protein